MVLPFSTERVLVGSSMAASLVLLSLFISPPPPPSQTCTLYCFLTVLLQVYWSSQLSFVELFGVWNWNGAVHGQALLKGTAIFLLATVVLFRILERGRWGRGRQRWKHQRAAGLELVCAFGAHMVGDLVLAYGHLLASLPFFLLGHVLYALAFAAPVRLSFESLCEVCLPPSLPLASLRTALLLALSAAAGGAVGGEAARTTRSSGAGHATPVRGVQRSSTAGCRSETRPARRPARAAVHVQRACYDVERAAGAEGECGARVGRGAVRCERLGARVARVLRPRPPSWPLPLLAPLLRRPTPHLPLRHLIARRL